MSETIINSKRALEDYKKFLDAQFEKHKYLRLSVKTGKQRTLTQNAALHKYCELVAEALNDAGIEFRQFHKDGYEVPWTMELVKNHIWRLIQKAVIGKESTAKAERAEYSAVYDVVNRKLSEFGVHVPWPEKPDKH